MKNLKLFVFFLGVVFIFGISPARAFFEAQAKYAFEHRWLPMLADPSAQKRFRAVRAFLAYPEWGLPLLRKAMIKPETRGVTWRIVMLLGMLGDPKDVPWLLKIWKHSQIKPGNSATERPEIWLGALQRLYWKHYLPDSRSPELSSLSFKFSGQSASDDKNKLTARLLFRIDNPAPIPRFVRVKARFWKTRLRENIPDRYYWIPAGGRIESGIKANLFPIARTGNIRLDFRVWEVGSPEVLIHKSAKISL